MTGSVPAAPTACPACGQSVPVEERFCASCGHDLGEPEYVCPSCAGTVALAERYCSHCGFDFETAQPVEEKPEAAVEPEAVRETPAAAAPRPTPQQSDLPAGLVYAGWGSRAGALLLDIVVLLTGLAVLAVVDGSIGLGTIVLFFGPPVYFWLLIGAKGQTLGKKAVGIHVLRSEDAGRVSYARALGRAASVVLLGVFVLALLLSYLWPLWDRRNQALHDKMAGTIVVRR
jgi:uncharacterized RDD family membrane protein YckC